MSKMNKSVKRVFIGVICVTLTLFVTVLIAKIRLTKKVNVGFYGISSSVQEKFIAELEKITDKNGKPFRYKYISLDTSVPAVNMLSNNVDLLIMYKGKNTYEVINEINKEKLALDSSILEGTTTNAASNAVFLNSAKVNAVPLLMDNVEILLNTKDLKKQNDPLFMSIGDLEKYMYSLVGKSQFPLVFAGSDNNMLINVVTAFNEVYCGKTETEQVQSVIADYKDSDYAPLFNRVDFPFKEGVRFLSKLTNDNVLPRNVYHMTSADVEFFMEDEIASIVITTLGEHRELSSKALTHYVSVPQYTNQRLSFFPSRRSNDERCCIANTICEIPLSGKKHVKYIAKKLISVETQESLSYSTGLAPVLARCHTPDLQADDARFWIASGNAPIVPVYNSAFTTSSQVFNFTQELKKVIMNNK